RLVAKNGIRIDSGSDVDLDSIRRIVEANHGVVEFQVEPEASEYRQTLGISDQDFEYLAQANAASISRLP
ncbi:MAG: hypothetical protein ACKOEO_16530, partial [Planctomycetaceae bacterium]